MWAIDRSCRPVLMGFWLGGGRVWVVLISSRGLWSCGRSYNCGFGLIQPALVRKGVVRASGEKGNFCRGSWFEWLTPTFFFSAWAGWYWRLYVKMTGLGVSECC